MPTLTGSDAIEYAATHGLTLNKYCDPTENARNGLTLDEARAIARVDPNLIWLQSATEIQFATEYGASGPYKVGVEYTVDAAGVHHTVMRPEYVERFVGYGLFDGQALAITAAGHYGPMSAWRMIGSGETEVRVIAQPSNAPRLNLPDEEHGHAWGDSIDIPSADPVVCSVAGRVIDTGAVLMALADHVSHH